MVRSASAVTTIMQRPVGSPSVAAGRREVDAELLQIVGEHRAEHVVAHPADVGGPTTEGRDARQRVGRRPAGHLGLGPHRGVQLFGALGVDQRHRPPLQRQPVDEGVVLAAEDVDEGVADAEDVEVGGRRSSRGVGHEGETLRHRASRRSTRHHPPGSRTAHRRRPVRSTAVLPDSRSTRARHRSTPPAHDGRTQPLRPDHRARPRRRDVRRHRVGRHRGERAGRRDRPARQGPRDHRRLVGGSGGRTPGRHGRRSMPTPRPSPSPCRAPPPPGRGRCTRRSRGVLNDKLVGFYRSTFTDVDGETRTLATTQFESHPRPPGLPVLGRAGVQGRLRRHARRRPTDLAAISNAAEVSLASRPATAAAAVHVRRHHGHVDLPGGVRGRPARGHRPRRRRRRAAAGRLPAGQGSTSPTSPSRSARSRCGSSPTGTASRTPATRST